MRPICITREGKSFELSHTFYMDDLKIVTKEMYEMVRADTIMNEICDSLHMKINKTKCGILNKRRHPTWITKVSNSW